MPFQDEPLRHRFGALTAQTARVWRRAVDRRLQPYGLTEATWLPLLRIARADRPMRQKELAASLSLDGSSVVRLLDALQAAGLIERREGEDDRRAKVILLTAAGRVTVDRVETVAREVREEALAEVTERELEAAFRVLERICGALAASELAGSDEEVPA